MNTRSVPRSVPKFAFFSSRGLFGFGFSAIGVLLAVLGFVAFPTSSASASQGQCGDVSISWYYGPGATIYYDLAVSPSTCTIYVTTKLDTGYPDDPSWYSNGSPISPTFIFSSDISIPYGHTMYIKAQAWQPNWTKSVNISSDEQRNPNI